MHQSPEMGREFHQTDQQAGTTGAQGSCGVRHARNSHLQLQGQGFLVQEPLILNQPVILLFGFTLGF